ncbi:MAG TPA: hypothetical protein VGR56_06320 [Nitrososphaerales archaeon]|nr:hypothetical protein [Nitrososphaerales archaeon]
MTAGSGSPPAEENLFHSSPKVNGSLLREFGSRLPPESALRYVLMLEKEEISASDFLARLPLYLALADKTLER